MPIVSSLSFQLLPLPALLTEEKDRRFQLPGPAQYASSKTATSPSLGLGVDGASTVTAVIAAPLGHGRVASPVVSTAMKAERPDEMQCAPVQKK